MPACCQGNVFGHLGDFGDLIAFLPTIRAFGGGHLCISHRTHTGKGPGYGRESLRGARYAAIEPLLSEQPYVRGVRWVENLSGVTHDASEFRMSQRGDRNLAQWQAAHFKTTISEDPWLTATPNEKYRGATIIARSSRYHERAFPWPQMLRENPDAIFVGLSEEHAAFQHRYGKIEYVPTSDLLELAEMMAAAKLVLANQTAAWWIAIGLGVSVTQETWGHSRDSVIHRPNARYFYTNEQPHNPARLRVTA